MAQLLIPAFSKSSRPVRVMSFGGGIQSVAIAALQVLGRIKGYDAYLFANVGDDSEEQATLDYFHNIFQPWAAKNGLVVHEIWKKNRDGSRAPTLYEAVMSDNRSIPIPVWMSGGAPGNRTCTTDWKIRVVNKWIREQKYTHAVQGIGFSSDESDRAKPEKEQWHNLEGMKAKRPRKLGFWNKQEYPLLDLGLSRADCIAIIQSVGLPIPPKSACKWCPFNSKSRWVNRKINDRATFDLSCKMEKFVNEKRGLLGKDRVTLHPGGQMLDVAIPDQIPMFDFEDGGCELGTCHT